MSTLTTLEQTIEAYAPDIDVPPPHVWVQAKQNIELQAALLREFGGATAHEVGDLNRSTSGSLADNWRRRGKVIRVTYRGKAFFPGFQFQPDGRPYPEIALVTAILRIAKASDWEQALWWTIPTGHLDRRRPVDVLVSTDLDGPTKADLLTSAAAATVIQD
jgi:hypothetical protein